jgi:hypothetical protein
MTVDEQYDLGASAEANDANDMKSAEVQKRFKAFQWSYLVVYLTVMGKVEPARPYSFLLFMNNNANKCVFSFLSLCADA